MNQPLIWRKSTFSGSNGSCVEFANPGDGTVWVRDSKLGDSSPVLRFSRSELAALIDGAKAGEFDDLV